MTSGEEWAAVGWGGEENVLPHDAAYEEMWALHLMPLGVMAIATGLFVTGKGTCKDVNDGPSSDRYHHGRNGSFNRG